MFQARHGIKDFEVHTINCFGVRYVLATDLFIIHASWAGKCDEAIIIAGWEGGWGRVKPNG
jgi:hypothetical protein